MSGKKQAEPQMKCLANQSQQPLSQDNLFPTLLSLLDVKTQVIDPKNDMLATCAHS
jgi:lipid A ethanolaminephosphotransferase